MKRNWLRNLRVRHKLLLITLVSLFSIVLFGYVSNYLFRTSNVVSYILKAERLHNVDFHSSVQEFYKYLHSGDDADLESSLMLLDRSNERAASFKELQEVYKTASDPEFRALVLKVFNGAVEDEKTYDFLTGRLRLMLQLGTDDLINGMGIAASGLERATQLRDICIEYVENPSPELLLQYQDGVDAVTVMEAEFAQVINQINSFVNTFLIRVILLMVLVLGALIYFLTYYISKLITQPVRELSSSMEEISKGIVNKEIELHSTDELGQLADSFRRMQDNLKEIIAYTKSVASGHFDHSIEPKSDKDELSVSLNRMSTSLFKASENDKLRDWHKTGVNELNDKMRGQQDVQELSREVITFFTKYLDGLVGVFYLYDPESKLLKLTSSYAFTERKEMADTFRLGEGLVGQVAYEKEMITLTEIPDDYTRIRSATGGLPPKYLMIAPVIFEEQLIGVIEIASFEDFNKNKQEFVREALMNIGIGISVAQASTRMARLLHQTQEQAQELQAQQEELRQSNEELEEQTKALKASEEALQTQQEELRVTNEELQGRTKELEMQKDDIKRKNDALEKATKDIAEKAEELELASKYKSEFLANMSHELRTPLNSILVLSQLLANNKGATLSEKQVEYASTIHSSGTDLLNLINEILDLSKVEAGKLELNPENVVVESVFDNLMQVFKPMTDDKGLDLNIEIEEGLPDMIITDAGRLQQILRNFLSNAVKFTSEGGVRLSAFEPGEDIRLRNIKLKPEECIAFSVKDTGIGIPKEKLKVVFEAFQQVDGTTSRKYGGTGLGLTISRSFAELLRGEIMLRSEEGKGSEFILIIPKKLEGELLVDIKPAALPKHENPLRNKRIEKPAAENPIKPEQLNSDEELSHTDENLILIIEDDEEFASVLQELAGEKGFKALISPDGEKGLHYADYYQPDAIILDVGLPGIDGWEVMDRLKENPNTRHIPVHFISGTDRPLDAMKMGAIGFLTKPVSLEKLNEVFSRIRNMASKPVKRLLIIEDDDAMRSSIVELIGGQDVESSAVASGKEACEILSDNSFDCIILDLGLSDMSGFDLLEKIRQKDELRQMPVIIYTGKDLSREEEERLQKYADSIIIKGVKSPERLLSETTLFLHRVESNLPAEKQEILHKVHHDAEEVLKGKNILLVDDDMRNVFALSSVLEEKGMNITVGRNGREGVDKLKANPQINLVLMDIMMPEMDGYEAMQLIRKLGYTKLPLIALTAKAMKDDRNKCIAAGANDYLSKPVDSEKLLSLLRVWLYK